MASVQSSPGSVVPRLMTSVKQLSPAELREFKKRFAEWQRQNGGELEDETVLVQACRARLSAAEERALRKFIGASERGTLNPEELADYRELARRAERLDATRLAALTELARRLGKPLGEVLKTVGWEGGADETKGRPARPAKAGSRSRR